MKKRKKNSKTTLSKVVLDPEAVRRDRNTVMFDEEQDTLRNRVYSFDQMKRPAGAMVRRKLDHVGSRKARS